MTLPTNSIIFHAGAAPAEVIRIDAKGFHYRGQFIEDAGEAHRLLVEYLRKHYPEGNWQHAHAEPEPEWPTDEELIETVRQSMEDCTFLSDLLYYNDEELMQILRAVLARWGNHPGSPDGSTLLLADSEVAGVAKWLHKRGRLADLGAKDWYFRAAELLERLSPPQPITVSERWPEFSDCDSAERVWCWSWAIGTWRLSRINQSIHSHWLPAHSLPVPSHD